MRIDPPVFLPLFTPTKMQNKMVITIKMLFLHFVGFCEQTASHFVVMRYTLVEFAQSLVFAFKRSNAQAICESRRQLWRNYAIELEAVHGSTFPTFTRSKIHNSRFSALQQSTKRIRKLLVACHCSTVPQFHSSKLPEGCFASPNAR